MREARRPKEDSRECTKVRLSLSELDILMLKLLNSRTQLTTISVFSQLVPGSAWLDTIYNLFSLFTLKSQAVSLRLAGQLPVKLSVRQPCLSHMHNQGMAESSHVSTQLSWLPPFK